MVKFSKQSKLIDSNNKIKYIKTKKHDGGNVDTILFKNLVTDFFLNKWTNSNELIQLYGHDFLLLNNSNFQTMFSNNFKRLDTIGKTCIYPNGGIIKNKHKHKFISLYIKYCKSIDIITQ
jgi:hypothetical protein